MKRPEVFCRVKGINLNWFTLVMKDRMNELSTTNDLKEAFKILDSIGQQDGSIDEKEFRQVLESIDADFT
jgi:Ca2+-binding EF-hand superfamily protein